MIKKNIKKSEAKAIINIALENFKQAEIEGAEEIVPVTYRWAKDKITKDKKIILKSNSYEKTQAAAEDANAACAQLLSLVREQTNLQKKDFGQMNELFEDKELTSSIDNLVNEGGIVS